MYGNVLQKIVNKGSLKMFVVSGPHLVVQINACVLILFTNIHTQKHLRTCLRTHTLANTHVYIYAVVVAAAMTAVGL